MPDPPAVRGVYETVLYARDVASAVDFFVDVVGLRAIDPPGDLSAAFRLPDGGLLLIFDPSHSSEPGRFVPSHGAEGEAHIAVRVDAVAAWREHLERAGVEIEREIQWSETGRSIYVRDPAGNSVEFVEGEIWDA